MEVQVLSRAQVQLFAWVVMSKCPVDIYEREQLLLLKSKSKRKVASETLGEGVGVELLNLPGW